MTGLLISEIAAWSLHRCHLVSQTCLPSWFPFWVVSHPSWFPFWAALGCRCRLVSQASLPSWFPFWAALGCRCRLVSQACLCSWLPFWAALGRLVSQACLLSRSAASTAAILFLELSSSFLLGCSWLQLLPCFPVLSSFSPFMLYLWFLCLYIFGGISRLVSRALLAYRT